MAGRAEAPRGAAGRARRSLRAAALRVAAVLVALKLALGAAWLGGALAGAATRITSTAPTDAGSSRRAAAVAGSPRVREVLAAVARRQAELEERAERIRSREEHLKAYEEDVAARIDDLEKIEKRLGHASEAAEKEAEEAAASLAKVYAAMKPAAAAPILDALDDATVLRILSKMRAKQVGELLPLLSREKAIGLTRALAAGGSAGAAVAGAR